MNNCTAGLHLAVQALGVEPGDEVLVAAYSFPATAHAVAYCGATPVFVDVRMDTGTIDVTLLDRHRSARTRGIIAVDALGTPADWDELEEYARYHDLWLIEDAACAAGGLYRGRPCGSFGDVAVFSLHARKGITSGEGGVVVTDDDTLADRMRAASCFGMRSAFERQQTERLEIPSFPELGYNYKLSDVLAAIGLVQLRKLEPFLAEREQVARRYEELLKDIAQVLPPSVPQDRSSTWQTYAVLVDENVDRDTVVMRLRQRGIGSNIGTYALHMQSVYRPSSGENATCPVARDLFRRHLALPMFSGLDHEMQQRVAGCLREALVSTL